MSISISGILLKHEEIIKDIFLRKTMRYGTNIDSIDDLTYLN